MSRVKQYDAASNYDPNRLFDALISQHALKNDAALCRRLAIQPPLVSKIRHGKLGISADMLIRMHEAFQIPIAELRRMMSNSG